jgi:signal peptidase
MTNRTYDCYRWEPKSSRVHVGPAIATTMCAVALLLSGLMLLPGPFGYSRYVITSGSMTGTYDRGSIVFDKVVPVDELRVGDVITYTPPPGAGPDGRITHRIAWVGTDWLGRRIFRTKGDANATPDPWTFTLDQPTQAKVAFHVPWVGYVFAALSIRVVRMLVIGLPALLLAAAALGGLRREANAAAAKRARR